MSETGDEAPPRETAPGQLLEDALIANVFAARTVNEAIREGRRDDVASSSFICECGALGCHAVVELAPSEYESVRAQPRRFVIAPGHEGAHDETVASTQRYAIIAKRGAAAEAAQSADPRAIARPPATYRVPSLSFAFLATSEAVPRARHLIGEFIKAHVDDAELRARILLAFTEAFTNAVVHAYDPARLGKIDVGADIEHGTLEIVVADQGRGFTNSQADGLGNGLGIIARSGDAFAIRERMPTGTEIWMQFALAPARRS